MNIMDLRSAWGGGGAAALCKRLEACAFHPAKPGESCCVIERIVPPRHGEAITFDRAEMQLAPYELSGPCFDRIAVELPVAFAAVMEELLPAAEAGKKTYVAIGREDFVIEQVGLGWKTNVRIGIGQLRVS